MTYYLTLADFNIDDSELLNKDIDKKTYMDNWNCFQCRDIDHYEKVAKIGQGTFGEVYKARLIGENKFVAMKKVLMANEREGFPITALREVKILQKLKHENIVQLIEVCRTKPQESNKFQSTFFLVFEFCEHDLAGLLSNANVKFNLGEIKKVLQQLLNALFYIHSNRVLHRDMKAANVLVTKDGVLKLADFGLSRATSKRKNTYTNRVVTLWYRAPELLLGSCSYGPAVDLWGAGCIMAEMWTRSPIMQGSSEKQQLLLISQLCGTLCEEVWPDIGLLPLYEKIELPKMQKRKVKDRLKPYVKDPYAIDLLDKLLTLDPSQRIDSDSALSHDFFWNEPMPSDLRPVLAQHKYSLFEYNSIKMKKFPQQTKDVPKNDNSYQDRIF